MPRPTEIYQPKAFGTPTHVKPVDASSLISALQGWQEEAQEQAIRKAERRGAEAGQAEGAGAAIEGREITGGHPDTRAGRAFLKAAESQWASQLEVDAQESAQTLVNDWNEVGEQNRFQGNLEAFDKAQNAARRGLLSHIQPEIAERHQGRVDQIFNRARQTVIQDYTRRELSKGRATAQEALARSGLDGLREARDKDELMIDPKTGRVSSPSIDRFYDLLGEQTAAGFWTPEEAQDKFEKFRQDIIKETYKGDYDDAMDKEGFIEEFKAADIQELTPQKQEDLARWMEGQFRAQSQKNAKSEGWRVFRSNLDKDKSVPEMDRELDAMRDAGQLSPEAHAAAQSYLAEEAQTRAAEIDDRKRDIFEKMETTGELDGNDWAFAARYGWTDDLLALQITNNEGHQPVDSTEVYEMLFDVPREDFDKIELRQWKGYLTQDTYKYFVRRRDELDAAKKKSSQAVQRIFALDDRAVMIGQDNEFLSREPKREWDENDHRRYQVLMAEIDNEMHSRGLDKKTVSDDDFDNIVKYIVSKKVKTKTRMFGWLGGKEIRAADVTEDTRIQVPVLIQQNVKGKKVWVRDPSGNLYSDAEVRRAFLFLRDEENVLSFDTNRMARAILYLQQQRGPAPTE
jgi:hypothetical protein